MNKDIIAGDSLGELPSINNSSSGNSSSGNSSGGLDKLMKSFNENKLQIVAFLSFFLFIIFTMSLVLGSVDFTGTDSNEKSYSGNKSLDKLYEEADGNEALSNARMTSKVDLSTEKYSCSYFVEYEGNNKRKVYCTSCPDSKEEDVTVNDEFCRQFVYGDEGDFEYGLLDNEYVSQRRARKESEADRDFAEGDLPECTRTLVDEGKLVGTAAGRKEQICSLNTSGEENVGGDKNLVEYECTQDEIEKVRNMKYTEECPCNTFYNKDVDCNANNENHTCVVGETSCISLSDTPDPVDAVTTVDSFRWILFLYLIIPLSLILLISIIFYGRQLNQMPPTSYTKMRTGTFILFVIILISHLISWGLWAHQYQKAQKRKNISSTKLDWYHGSGIIVIIMFFILSSIILIGDKKPKYYVMYIGGPMGTIILISIIVWLYVDVFSQN